jgi:hypothetical protein
MTTLSTSLHTVQVLLRTELAQWNCYVNRLIGEFAFRAAAGQTWAALGMFTHCQAATLHGHCLSQHTVGIPHCPYSRINALCKQTSPNPSDGWLDLSNQKTDFLLIE